MAAIYLETSFVSACVTTRADIASAYRRQQSLEWWGSERTKHEIYTSAEVLRELSAPSYPMRDEALAFVADVSLIELNEEIAAFAAMLVQQRVMPGPLEGDALHVAAACVAGMDYVSTWNVKHLANRQKVTPLKVICARAGLIAPEIVTPDALWY